MKKILSLITITTLHIGANSLNSSSLGRGGVDMAIGKESKSIFINPANLSNFSSEEIKVEILSSSISLDKDTSEFIDALSSSNSSGKVSKLMNKNIGKSLNISGSNFTSIYTSKDNYSYLLGVYSDVDGYFITHTGFGSMGAMESYIDRYNTIVGNISFKKRDIKYGLNLRAVNRYRTTHRYNINEIIETDNILKYFDNRYTKGESILAFDIGVITKRDNGNFAISTLDIGNSSFKGLGTVKSTTNMGYSNTYRGYLVGVDYIDIFQSKENKSVKESVRFGISRDFFNKNLTLSSGILNQELSYGLEYQYSIFDISLNSYKNREINGVSNRKYQLSISLRW